MKKCNAVNAYTQIKKYLESNCYEYSVEDVINAYVTVPYGVVYEVAERFENQIKTIIKFRNRNK